MHGLILAGGEGSRLLASGVTTPKALVPVGGVPQLLRLARTLDRLGCESITCLLREGVRLGALAADLARLRAAVELRSCCTPSSLHTLVQGLAVVPPGPVFCSMVDTVMPLTDWIRLYGEADCGLAAGADAVLAVTPFIDDERSLFVGASRDGRVTALGDAPTQPALVTGGVYALGRRARAAAWEALTLGHERMRALLVALVQRGYDLRAVEIAKIIDLDHRRDLDQANAWQESCEDGGAPMG